MCERIFAWAWMDMTFKLDLATNSNQSLQNPASFLMSRLLQESGSGKPFPELKFRFTLRAFSWKTPLLVLILYVHSSLTRSPLQTWSIGIFLIFPLVLFINWLKPSRPSGILYLIWLTKKNFSYKCPHHILLEPKLRDVVRIFRDHRHRHASQGLQKHHSASWPVTASDGRKLAQEHAANPRVVFLVFKMFKTYVIFCLRNHGT